MIIPFFCRSTSSGDIPGPSKRGPRAMNSHEYSSYGANIPLDNSTRGGMSAGCRRRSSSTVDVIILFRLSGVQATRTLWLWIILRSRLLAVNPHSPWLLLVSPILNVSTRFPWTTPKMIRIWDHLNGLSSLEFWVSFNQTSLHFDKVTEFNFSGGSTYLSGRSSLSSRRHHGSVDVWVGGLINVRKRICFSPAELR